MCPVRGTNKLLNVVDSFNRLPSASALSHSLYSVGISIFHSTLELISIVFSPPSPLIVLTASSSFLVSITIPSWVIVNVSS